MKSLLEQQLINKNLFFLIAEIQNEVIQELIQIVEFITLRNNSGINSILRVGIIINLLRILKKRILNGKILRQRLLIIKEMV